MHFLPLLPLPVGVVGQKRPFADPDDSDNSESDDSSAAPFNPAEDPEEALRTFGSVREELSAVQLESALNVLADFLRDMAAGKTVIYDIETTELISRAVPFERMSISCATVLVVDPSRPAPLEHPDALTLTFWHPDAQRGAPLELLPVVLSACRQIVAYNAAFDLRVTAAGRTDVLRVWSAKVFDPMTLIESYTGRRHRLAQVLAVNGIEAKGGSGAEAPGQWARREFDALEAYNLQDVRCLALLVLRPRIKAPGGMAVSGLVAVVPAAPPPAPPTSTRNLVQGSQQWLDARKGLISASRAAALCSLSPFSTRDQAFEAMLYDEEGATTEQMRRGIREEGAIAGRYQALFPEERLETTGLWLDEALPWLGASPDRLTPNAVVEIKRVSKLTATPPIHYRIQMLLQMKVTGRRIAKFVQWDGKELQVDAVYYDRETMEDLIEMLEPMAGAVKQGRADPENGFPPEFDRRTWLALREGLGALRVERISPSL